MPKGYNVDDILDEFEARRRPPKPPKAEEPTPARQPFKLRSFEDTADLGPVQPAQQASFDSHATRLDIPVASPNTGANLGRTMVIETDALREELARDRAEAEDRAARRERLRKFASLTALPDEEDMPEEDEESFMSLGALRRAKQAEKQAKKAAKVMGDASPAIGIKTAETPPIDEEAAPVVEEFSSLGDAAIIERDLAGLWGALLFRLIVSLAGFGGILYLSLMSLLPKALPGSTLLTDTPVLYMGMMTGMLALLCLVSNKVVGGGLMALFRLKATNDTPLALSALASLGLGAALTAGPGRIEVGYTAFYFTSVAAGFVFNALGKLFMVARIRKNFALACAEEVCCVVPLDEATGGRLGGRSALQPVRAKLAGSFLAISYSDDLAETLSRVTTPVFLGFSAAVALITFFISGDGMLALTALAALLAMAAPLTATLCGSLPFYRACRRLSPSGSAVCGHSAIDTLEDTDALILEAADLFPPGTAVLHGIKSFAEGRIDRDIVMAASLLCQREGLLSSVFLQVLGGRRDMLSRVDAFSYEDNRGIRATVDGEAVFLGGRDLMRAHGIAAPSRDYEQKFTDGDKDILYLANAREVTAMFVVSYHPDETLEPLLRRLCDRGIMLMVRTTDPNITAARIAEAYDLRDEYVRILPQAVAEQLPGTAVQDEAPAYLIAGDSVADKLRVVAAIHTLRGSVLAATALQLIGMIIGYALIAFSAFMGAMDSMGFVQVLVYQLFWALLSMLAACIGRL